MKLRPGVTFHDGEKFDAAAVKFNIERHKNIAGSNRRGELLPVSTVDVVDDMTVKLNLSAPFSPLLTVLADRAGMMVSPKAAQAMPTNFGTKPVCSGPVQVRRARRAGPHRGRALRQLLGQGPDPFRQDHLPADRGRHGAPGQPEVRPARLHRARGAGRHRVDQEGEQARHRPHHRAGLPGHHHQHRQERPGAEESAGQRPAGARGVRAVAGPRRHRQGGDGRRGRGRQPVGAAEQQLLCAQRADPQARRRAGQGAAEGSGRHQSHRSP